MKIKTPIAAAVLFVATSVFAQQPPIPNCITNVIVTITDTNAAVGNGDSQTNGTLGMTVTVQYYGCPLQDTTIGYYTCQCDTTRTCGTGEGGGPAYCPAGNTYPLIMPAGCYGMNIRVYTLFGCCSLAIDKSNMQWCRVPPGC